MNFSISSSIDRGDVFIGQSVVYTVKIKTDKDTEFTLDAPLADTAVTMKLDDLVYENGAYIQRYIIIPVQAGTVNIGTAVAHITRKGEDYNPYAQFFDKAQADKDIQMFRSDSQVINVRAADPGCLPWLAATDVQAIRKRDGDVVSMSVTAYGQLGQLIEKPDMSGMVVHGHADTEITGKGIIGRRTDSWKVQGNTILPAYSVKWWDDNAGVCRSVEVPPMYVPGLMPTQSVLHQPLMWLVLAIFAITACLFIVFVIMLRNYFKKKRPRELYPL